MRKPARLLGAFILALAGTAACAASDEVAAVAEADGPAHSPAGIVAVSDIHGAADAFERVLLAAGIIDSAGHWQGGERQLVITGDLLDRGDDSRRAMDLLMRLEGEAAQAGGAVHVLLGNHEIMNLVGDLRYVAPGEYAAFAGEEDALERARWREAFIVRAASGAPPAELAAQFERAHPPGFFAHRRAFRADGRYGAWLLDKPLVAVIDGVAFAHGGIAPEVAARGLQRVNDAARAELRQYVDALATVIDAGLLQPGDSFYNYRELLAALPEDPSRDAALVAAVDVLLATPEQSVHDLDSPAWYRGHAACPTIVEADRLRAVLDALGAQRIVVGHTPTATRDIVSRLDGRIVEIDTGMLSAYYGGSAHALLIHGARLEVLNEEGKAETIKEDPRPQASTPLDTAALLSLLAEGEVSLAETPRGDGGYPATVSQGGREIKAVFLPSRARRGSPDMAAWHLDRLLGLGLVPPTVERRIQRMNGALQALPARRLDEAERAANQSGGGAWCPLNAQWQAMFVFDALIHNRARGPANIIYDAESWQLYLSGHGAAFGTERGRPKWLANVEFEVSPAWRERLAALDEGRLEEVLGEHVSRRARRALLQRRDELLSPD